MDKRKDRLMGAYVDLAVNVTTAFGVAAGVRVLHNQGVPRPWSSECSWKADRGAERPCYHPPMNRRTDFLRALRINWILAIKPEKGMSFSARALYDLGVPLSDAIRLLTRADQRRSTQAIAIVPRVTSPS